MKRSWNRLALLVAGCLGAGCGSGQSEAPAANGASDGAGRPDWIQGDFPDDLPRPVNGRASLSLAGQKIQVELAATGAGRNYGLMFVDELPDDRGMLFVYPEPQDMSFWMRNTKIPLDIAFIAELGAECRVVNIHSSMRPFQESPSYSSVGACRFALELPGGWAERHGLKAGDPIQIPEHVRSMQVEGNQNFPVNLPRRIGR